MADKTLDTDKNVLEHSYANKSKNNDKANLIITPKIVVAGVGGGGCNAIEHMLDDIEGVKFIACNTDAQALANCKCPNKIQLGPRKTRGLGAGASREVGREAMLESLEEVVETFADAHMLFITAAAGGGTGGGGAPEVGRAARERGILTIGFVTTPFEHEGSHKEKSATAMIEEMQKNVDCLIVANNQRLLGVNDKTIQVEKAFAMIDNVLKSGIIGIVKIINKSGLINVDFQDVTRVMKDRMSRIIFGIGQAEGENAGSKAAALALSNPLIEVDQETLKKVDTALLSVTGGANLSLQNVKEAAEYLRSQINTENDNLIVGMTTDTNMPEDAVEVCIFASCPKTIEKTEEDFLTTGELTPEMQKILKRANEFATEPINKTEKATTFDADEDDVIGESHGSHLDLQEESSQYKINTRKTSTQHENIFKTIMDSKKKWFG